MSRARLRVVPLLTVEQTAAWTTECEQREAAAFPSEERRREYLSWRAVVRQELGHEVEIAYNELGAPILVGRAEHLAVSHGAGRVAVLIAERPCGVDIERWGRDFRRAVNRFLTDEERALASDEKFWAVAWCAKESLYKAAGESGLVIRDQLRILSYHNDHLTAQIKDGEVVTLSVSDEEDYLLVSVVLD